VICFVEWGPLELKPHGGTAWVTQRRPRRMRATYHRLHGVRHFLGFYDVHAHVLGGRHARGMVVSASGTTNAPSTM
jgi:hypothetical protein